MANAIKKKEYANHVMKGDLVLPSGLTDREEKFCLEYILNQNTSDATRVAGYETDTPAKLGYQLLNRPSIKRFIEANKAILEKNLKEKYFNSFYMKAELLWEMIFDLKDSMTEKNKAAYVREIRANIAELNKMQGDYAPEKSLSVNVDWDEEIRKVRDLIPKYERGY